MGYDAAGTVVAVGTGVTKIQVGDEVYSRVPEKYRGTVAEYVLSSESATSAKPATLDFTQSASIPLAALTALQSLQEADKKLPGGLKGKTVFVPAGLSGTGSFALQLAKNVFEAGKVITTVSTKKISKVGELLGEGCVDQIVDYTKEDVTSSIGQGTVDFLFDTVAGTLSFLPVMKKGGVIVTVSTVPNGTLISKNMPEIPFLLKHVLNLGDWFFTWRAGRYGCSYEYLFMHPSAEDLSKLAWWIGEGKVKPIVGRTAKLSDIAGVKDLCQE